MSSIIEGYTYDIFISYCQKDNKGDRWLSEFVDALKTELESTLLSMHILHIIQRQYYWQRWVKKKKHSKTCRRHMKKE